MAITSGYFNSVNGDRKYNADQMSEYFDAIVNQGVFQHYLNGLAVSAGTGLSVSVATGKAIIQSKWVKNDATVNLTISAASTSYARIDAVVIRLSNSSRMVTIAVKDGTPSANPSAPSMTRAGGTYEMALAYVNVAANATSVTVTDKRSDTSVCGWATVAQETSGEVDAMLEAMKTGFDGVVYSSPAAQVQGSDSKLNAGIEDCKETLASVCESIFNEYTPGSNILNKNVGYKLKSDGTLEAGSSSGQIVSDFISIENKIIKSLYAAYAKNSSNVYVPIAFYSAANESSFISSYIYPDEETTYWAALHHVPNIPDGAKYIRISGNPGQFATTPTVTLIDISEPAIEQKIDEFCVGKNLIGMDPNIYYPVHIDPGTKLTLSSSDGSTSTSNSYYIEFYGEDKSTRIAYVTFSVGLSERTWTYDGASTALYAKWNAVPVGYDVQLEVGDNKTTFEKYFGNPKLNYSLIQDVLPRDTIFERCKDQILNIRNASGLNRGSYGEHDFTMLLMADSHSDTARMQNAYSLTDGCDVIDAVLHLGDVYGYSPTLANAPIFTAIIDMTDKPAFVALGNHDQRVAADIDVTTKQVVDAFLRETHQADMYEDGGYGYYDFDDYKIRMIILNCFDMPDTKSSGSYIYYGSETIYQQTQISWLINTLDTVPEDYTVIIGSHYVEPTTLDQNVIHTHPEFIGASYSEGTTWGSIGRMSGTIISDIVDAYMNKTTLSRTYTYSMNGASPGSVVVDADFSSAYGEFACYLTGHMHCHAIGHITNHMDQVVYFHDSSRATINNSSWTTVSSLFSRDTDSQNQDLVTAFSIDTVNKMLKFVRIGAHVNVYGEDYNFVKYSYAVESDE